MKRDRLFGLISLSCKAGKLQVGFEPALEATQSGEAALILTAQDLSEKSLKRLQTKLAAYDSPPRVLPTMFTMEELAHITHKLTGICTVCDTGFAKGIETLMTDDEEDTI